MKNVNLLVFITQLGLSVVAPPTVLILLAVWLRDRFDLGSWVVIVGVIVGVICGFDGFRVSMRTLSAMSKDKEEKPPVAFNDHE